MSAVFVSDLHIRGSQDPKCTRFERFLDRLMLEKPEHLFLVGDIFDLWVADRAYFLDTYSTVIERLRALISAGIQVHYFEGNHDLDLEVFWRDHVGCQTYGEAAYFELYGRIVRVEHGDQMDPDDRGYLFLRWFLRTPLMRVMGRQLPNAAVKAIGERASRASREYTTQVKTATAEQVQAKLRTHAEKVFTERPFDVLISGHVHVKIDEAQRFGDRDVRLINLGSWLGPAEPVALMLDPSGARWLSV